LICCWPGSAGILRLMETKFIIEDKKNEDGAPTVVLQTLDSPPYSRRIRFYYMLIPIFIFLTGCWIIQYIFVQEHSLDKCPKWQGKPGIIQTHFFDTQVEFGLKAVCAFGTAHGLTLVIGHIEDLQQIVRNFTLDHTTGLGTCLMPARDLVLDLNYDCLWGAVQFKCPIEYRSWNKKRMGVTHYQFAPPPPRPRSHPIWHVVVSLLTFILVVLCMVYLTSCLMCCMALVCCCSSLQHAGERRNI
jgi:hypothetical protein